MRRWTSLIAAVSALAGTGLAAAQDYHPAFAPSHLKGPHVGPPNEVLVLGTAHLSGLLTTFRAADLQPLLDRLAAWHPQAIAIEALSGAQCDQLRRYPDRYKDTVEGYCWDPAPARAATGLDVPAATAAAKKLLAHWPASPSAGDRRRLAALFLAGGDQPSAVVQWLRLPEAERHAGDGLDATLVARLDLLKSRANEDYWIAAPLAARLGLERLTPMDDHSADFPDADEEAAGKAISKAWDNPATAKRKATDEALRAKLDQPGAILAMYRTYNAPDQAKLTFDSDFGAALEEPSAGHYGRGYLGSWETRNLRMASNIRDMLAQQPGIRALVIVGASHKFYLEDYLDQMHDVRLVDAENVLR